MHGIWSGTGDILVFLPTPDDVADAVKRMKGLLEAGAEAAAALVLPLHGKLQPEEQQEVFQPTPDGMRKVVFTTNVAETSVTIEGIVSVIDTGLAKQSVYDPARSMNSLVLTFINKSSATQRAGRAGRTRPGIWWVVARPAYTHIHTYMHTDIQA